jgi:hypothetical protein
LIKTNFSRAADILTSNPAGSFLGVPGWPPQLRFISAEM